MVDFWANGDIWAKPVGATPPGRWAIRIGLAQVARVGEELAAAILWERQRAAADGTDAGAAGGDQGRLFASAADFCARLRAHGLSWPAAEALALVGAFDGLPPRMGRRERLWRLREAWPLVVPATEARRGAGRRRRGRVSSLRRLPSTTLGRARRTTQQQCCLPGSQICRHAASITRRCDGAPATASAG